MNPDLTPDAAEFLFHAHGYRMINGEIWMTTHDEPETGWEGRKVSEWSGSIRDAYEALSNHWFPDDENITCGECKTNEVESLGDFCRDCGREISEWIKAGEYM